MLLNHMLKAFNNIANKLNAKELKSKLPQLPTLPVIWKFYAVNCAYPSK